MRVIKGDTGSLDNGSYAQAIFTARLCKVNHTTWFLARHRFFSSILGVPTRIGAYGFKV